MRLVRHPRRAINVPVATDFNVHFGRYPFTFVVTNQLLARQMQ